MNKQHIPVVILALNKETISDDTRTINSVLGVTCKHVLGRYTMDNGETVEENSYVVPLLTVKLNAIIKLSRDHNQESILYLDNQRQAWLIYCEDNSRQYIGQFVKVSEQTAKNSEAYTFDKTTNTYYICRL